MSTIYATFTVFGQFYTPRSYIHHRKIINFHSRPSQRNLTPLITLIRDLHQTHHSGLKYPAGKNLRHGYKCQNDTLTPHFWSVYATKTSRLVRTFVQWHIISPRIPKILDRRTFYIVSCIRESNGTGGGNNS